MPVDALVHEDRTIPTETPGIHALVVGVSDYLNLPKHDDPPKETKWFMNKLTSPAVSAFAFYERLMRKDLRLPLKTVRLLASPSEVELGKLAANPDWVKISATVPRASRSAFEQAARDWRDDAGKNSEDMVILFFSGHGVQRVVDEGIVLFDDFLEDERALNNAVTIEDLRAGLTPSALFPNIALTQFFFIDTCLLQPEAMKKFANPQVPQVFGPLAGGPADRRESAVMFSTVDRAVAIARDGQTSHFTEGLLRALDHGAEDCLSNGAVSYWPVTAHTLKTAINLYYAGAKVGTSVKMDHYVGEPMIRKLASPPDVDLAVVIIPDTLPCIVGFVNESDVPAPGLQPFQQTKFTVQVKAGFYRMQVASDRLAASPFRSRLEWINQKKSHIPWSCDLAGGLI